MYVTFSCNNLSSLGLLKGPRKALGMIHHNLRKFLDGQVWSKSYNSVSCGPNKPKRQLKIISLLNLVNKIISAFPTFSATLSINLSTTKSTNKSKKVSFQKWTKLFLKVAMSLGTTNQSALFQRSNAALKLVYDIGSTSHWFINFQLLWYHLEYFIQQQPPRWSFKMSHKMDVF